MKKKILSFVIGLCLIIPSIFAFTACSKSSIYEVSESEWHQALNVSNEIKVSITQTFDDKTSIITKDGSIILTSANVGGKSVDTYITKVGTSYTTFCNETGTWVETSITKVEYDAYLSNLDFSGSATYSDYYYDETNKCYTGCAFLGSISNPKIYFENGKLVKIVGNAEGKNVSYIFDYDNISLTLPI